MLDFLGALWNYAAEYFITLMGIWAFAMICIAGANKQERRKFEREQKKLLNAWGLK